MTAAQSSPSEYRTVLVALGSRSYDVLIGPGLLASAGATVTRISPAARAAIVTDETVAGYHLPALEAGLGTARRVAGKVVLPPGEATKSFACLEPLCEQLLVMGLERGDLVIAFGGGVIGDLAGFAASILRRGVRVVQIPTTLLAQVDSSVGGKTGINTPQGKNLIGTFHQPSLVLADTDVLATLPPRQMRAGYAEVLKYALIGDASFFDYLEAAQSALFLLDPAVLTCAIETSVRAKAAIVARDETETGDRALLNLGHTFGHALEVWAGYSDRLLHGEAVAIGMAMAFRFSESEGLSPEGTAQRMERHLAKAGLPTGIHAIPGGRPSAPDLLRLMEQDKKVRGGRMTLILVHGIGEAFIARDVAREKIEAFLKDQVTR